MVKTNTILNNILSIGICILLILVCFFSTIGFGINNENIIGDKIKSEYNQNSNTIFINDEWPMYNYDLNNSGFSPSLAPNTSTLLWKRSIGYSRSSPAVVDGKVYIGSGYNVVCYNAINGNLIWTYQTSDEVHSSPAVIDGRVYIGSWDDLMYCLDAETGDRIWIYPTGGISSSPTVCNGKVYVGANYLNGCWVYCLETDMGNLVWKFKTGDRIDSTPAVSEGKVYIGSQDEKLYCLNAENGSLLWSFNTNGWIYSSPAVYKDYVYIGNDKFYCVNKGNGKEVWNFSAGYSFAPYTPTIAYDKVYIPSFYGNIFCLDANNGNKIWEYKTGGYIYQDSTSVADAKVFVGSDDGHINCLDALTGKIIWNYKLDGNIESSSAIAYGKVYIRSKGTIYCFGINQPPYVRIVNPREDYIHLFGIPLFLTNLNLRVKTVSIGGFRSKPVQIKAYDDLDKDEDLIIKILLNGRQKGIVNYNNESGYFEWFWKGISIGNYYLKIQVEDSLGRIGNDKINIRNFCFLP